jgi:hypothetical protein
MDDLEKLIAEIEKLRAQLHVQGICRGLQDNDVLKQSEMLDNLINQYYRLMQDTACNKVR